MNVLLISQCTKNALKETRRILDQFAERRGERTWQTPITRQGLDTLRRLLRKRARRNSAIACHWIRAKDHSELLWIVGDASRFNERGAVPTNTTRRNVLRGEDENDWHTAEEIRLVAAMAALFHDLGKANRTFQKKLKSTKPLADPLRHEWVSLRLFEAFVGNDDDRTWLTRLAELAERPDLRWMERVVQDETPDDAHPSPFVHLPPLARLIGWLIVSHHRLPTDYTRKRTEPHRERRLSRLPEGIYANWNGARLSTKWIDAKDEKERKRKEKEYRQAIAECWKFDKNRTPFTSEAWRKRVRRFARRLLERERLFDEERLRDNSYLAHLARLTLMLADHHYSSLSGTRRWAKGDADYPLLANTLRPAGEPNQPLDEHIIGVEMSSGRVIHALPRLAQELPRLAGHTGFRRRSADRRFRWQDRAFDLAGSLREASETHGFFGINMASTGLGKTLANGRILYALADPNRGARFSIALGLRTLTLQTGEVYRQRLELGDDQLAVLVGGGAVRELHEHQQRMEREAEAHGNESAEPLLPENSYVHYEGSLGEGPLKAWIANQPGADALLQAPILACTIDHLTPATEGIRGGRQIAPMLRLMSGDLVLDEPDDFDIDDLPALTRLVHWAGLLGSRVLLSSATLPPALVEGLFAAYAEGRHQYRLNRGTPGDSSPGIVTAWFDEFDARAEECGAPSAFSRHHQHWAAKRAERLGEEEVRRRAEILPLPNTDRNGDATPAARFSEAIHTAAHALHHRHHTPAPHGEKRISFGLVRMANINPLVAVTRALAAMDPEAGHRIHLCCYHAKHPLLVRSNIERRLDRLLDRKQPERIFDDPELRATLDHHPERDHLFIVLATPVAEVGRDHDYDWAIVEPSSMRSIIQLAGRVRRHRREACDGVNIQLLATNFKALNEGGGKPAFLHPGFEQEEHFELESHQLDRLLTEAQYRIINAIPRIVERDRPDPRNNLADLEHEHLRVVMLGDDAETARKAAVTRWWETHAHLTGEQQRTQPFRFDPHGRQRYALLNDEESEQVAFHRIEEDGGTVEIEKSLEHQEFPTAPGVSSWGETGYLRQLEQLAEERGMGLAECSRRFGTLELPSDEEQRGWYYHPGLGVWRK